MPFDNNANKFIKDLKLPLDMKQKKCTITPNISYKNTIIEKSNDNSIASYIIKEESNSNSSKSNELLYE